MMVLNQEQFFFPGKFSHIWGHFWLSQLRGGGILLVSSTGAAKRPRMMRTIHNRKLSRPDCPLGQSWEMLFSREIKKKKKTIKGLKSLKHGMLETRRSYIILNRWQCWRQRNDKIYKDTWIIFQNRLNVFCEFKTEILMNGGRKNYVKIPWTCFYDLQTTQSVSYFWPNCFSTNIN